MSRGSFQSLFGLVAIIGLWLSLRAQPTFAQQPPSPRKPKVVCFGDSITKRGYSKILAGLIGVDAINAGVGGNSTAKGLRRMSTNVLAHDPDVVVIFFGTNDLRVDEDRVYVPVAQYKANLETMVANCRTQGARVVLCTLPPIEHEAFFTRHNREPFDALGGLAMMIQSYREAAQQVATEQKVSLVDLNGLLEKEPTWISKDGVHPSEDGVAMIAKHVAKSVAAVIGTTHHVKSADDIEALLESDELSAGDTILWADGEYSDVELMLHGVNGTPTQPITFRAATPGGVVLRGESRFHIGAKWWVVEGFHFEGREGEFNSYNAVEFRGRGDVGAQHVRLTNCAMTNLVAEDSSSKWILMYGRFNTIDHCHFSGKNSKGALLTVELGYLAEGETAEHRIASNYFGNFIPQGGTDNETIRIGFSGDQNKPATCLVERNCFFRCNGDAEIISNKSSFNTYRSNTFRQCDGALVLRHGHHARVEGNYFFGDGANDAGGIRVSDSHHVIVNNYMQDLTGTTWNSAFSILGGKKVSGQTSNGYQAVDAIVVAHNSIINCKRSVFLNNAKGSRAPTGLMANNLIVSSSKPLILDKLPPGKMTWAGNLFHGAPVGAAVSGITADPQLKQLDGLLRPDPSGPAVDTADNIAAKTAASFAATLGNDTAAATEKDVDGQKRPQEKRDIGADEVVGATGSVSLTPLDREDVGVSFPVATATTSTPATSD